MAPTPPKDQIKEALAGILSFRANRRRYEKAAARGKVGVVPNATRSRGEAYNEGRRKRRAQCRRFGISGKRFRYLERKARRINREAGL